MVKYDQSIKKFGMYKFKEIKLSLFYFGKVYVDGVDIAGDVRWLYIQSYRGMYQFSFIQVYFYIIVLCYIIYLEIEYSLK